jgi:hypothetical protein
VRSSKFIQIRPAIQPIDPSSQEESIKIDKRDSYEALVEVSLGCVDFKLLHHGASIRSSRIYHESGIKFNGNHEGS